MVSLNQIERKQKLQLSITDEWISINRKNHKRLNKKTIVIAAIYWGLATVTIVIDDVNDHDPVFGKTFYRRSLPENSKRGAPILTVSADDADINRTMTYNLQGWLFVFLFCFISFDLSLLSSDVSLWLPWWWFIGVLLIEVLVCLSIDRSGGCFGIGWIGLWNGRSCRCWKNWPWTLLMDQFNGQSIWFWCSHPLQFRPSLHPGTTSFISTDFYLTLITTGLIIFMKDCKYDDNFCFVFFSC